MHCHSETRVRENTGLETNNGLAAGGPRHLYFFFCAYRMDFGSRTLNVVPPLYSSEGERDATCMFN